MKQFILTTGITVLLLIIVVGCKEKDIQDIYDPNSIIGKWQIIHHPKYCPGFDRMIEFTADSLFKSYVDSKMDFTSTFNIKTGTIGYDTIFYHDHTGYYSYELINLKSSDTLHLIPPILTALPICYQYKRKN